MSTRFLLRATFALALLVGVSERAKADLTITVANSSFEQPAVLTLGNYTNDSITSWTYNDSGEAGTAYGVFYPTTSELNGPPPRRPARSLTSMARARSARNFLASVVAGGTYTLSFWVAPRLDDAAGSKSMASPVVRR